MTNCQKIKLSDYFKDKDCYIIFMVTKNRERESVTYENMYTTLVNLKQVCGDCSTNNLVMNNLGQGENHEWKKVIVIRYIFSNTHINILICAETEYTKKKKLLIL